MQASVQSDDCEDPYDPSVNQIMGQLFKASIQSAKVTCHSRRARANNALCVSDDFPKSNHLSILNALPHIRAAVDDDEQGETTKPTY